MDKKEIIEKRKQNILEGYELDSYLASCIEYFERDENSIDFEIKDVYECDECLSDTCFALLEKKQTYTHDHMFG